jgi:hypothetical protein
MQSANEKKFNKTFKSLAVQKIMGKVCNRYLGKVCTRDEILSLKMSTLWSCITNFKDGRNAKFTSYLYRSIKNNARRLYKQKLKRELTFIDNIEYAKDNRDIQEARDILESVKDIDPEMHKILMQKFFYRMTNKEIAKENGYGQETARKRVQKALDLCRKIVYTNIG